MIYIFLFFILAMAILLGSHFLLYLAIVKYFNEKRRLFKRALFFSFIFLAASFIISSILSRSGDNLFVKFYYIFSMVWIGIFVNLLLASLLITIIAVIAKLLKIKIKMPLIALIIFSLGFSYSVYGVWNSRRPIIKNIDVKINNLSSYWENKKIVHISDIHLGHINGQNFLQNIANKINLINPDAVFITGDLFDGMDGQLSSFIAPLESIKAKEGIFYVTGNHETYLGVKEILPILNKAGVKVLDDEFVEIEGLQIIGVSYPSMEGKKNAADVASSMEYFLPDKANILLYHSPEKINSIKNTGIDLLLAGHTHKGQLFPFGYITKLIYKGYDYGLHEEGNFSIYTTSGVGTWGPPMRTGNSPEIVVVWLR